MCRQDPSRDTTSRPIELGKTDRPSSLGVISVGIGRVLTEGFGT